MSPVTGLKPRSIWSRLQRGAFVAMAVGGILFFLMRDTVAHKIVHVDILGGEAVAAYKPNLPAQWGVDLDGAKVAADESGKPILAVFSAEWCAPCQEMIRNVYPEPQVISALNSWIPVYIDGDAHPELAAEYKVSAFPTFLILNGRGAEMGRFVGGAATASAFLVRLETAVDYDEKLKAAEAAVAESPDSSEALHRLGDLKMAAVDDSESFMEAVAVYRRALQANPDETGNIEPELADLLKKSVKIEKEVATISEQIATSPDEALLYKKRADLKADDPMAQDAAGAIEDYRKAVSLDPDNRTGAAGDLRFFEIREGLNTPNPDIGKVAGELEAFESMYADSSRVPDSLILRAYMNLQSGRMEEGAMVLQSLVEKFPQHEAAESARELLKEISEMANQPSRPSMRQ